MDTTSTLDKILDSGRQSHVRTGLEYVGSQTKGNQTIFVKAIEKIVESVPKYVVKQSRRMFRFYLPICHYCHKCGHIIHECYRFYCD